MVLVSEDPTYLVSVVLRVKTVQQVMAEPQNGLPYSPGRLTWPSAHSTGAYISVYHRKPVPPQKVVRLA